MSHPGSNSDYTEANAWQYSLTPALHDPQGLQWRHELVTAQGRHGHRGRPVRLRWLRLCASAATTPKRGIGHPALASLGTFASRFGNSAVTRRFLQSGSASPVPFGLAGGSAVRTWAGWQHCMGARR